MEISDLRTELYARGYDYLNTDDANTRADLFLNRSYNRICEREPWPFLRATTTGTAPLTISDLRQVLFVEDTTNDIELVGTDERDIRHWDPDITSTGNPEFWWLSGGTVLNVYPPNTTVSLRVVYLEVPDALSDSNTTPVLPTRYHYLIVQGAVFYALQDNDEPEAASQAEAIWEGELDRMSDTLLAFNYQNPYEFTDVPAYDR